MLCRVIFLSTMHHHRELMPWLMEQIGVSDFMRIHRNPLNIYESLRPDQVNIIHASTTVVVTFVTKSSVWKKVNSIF